MPEISKKVKVVFIFAIIAIIVADIFFVFNNSTPINNIKAGTNIGLSGYAWSENAGWVSFNSENCDANGNGYIDVGACGGEDDIDTPIQDYVVSFDNVTGDLSGYAWNENVGWITFNGAEVAGCPSGICQPRYVPDNYSGTTSAIGGLGNNAGANGSVIIEP